MKTFYLLVACSILMLLGCSRKKHFEKGFPVSPETETSVNTDGLSQDSGSFKTRPGSVILTGNSDYRVTPVYKLNYNKRGNSYFTGNNSYYQNYSDVGSTNGNQWHGNFLPGLQAIYGYNLVNVSLRNVKTQIQNQLFGKPVLVKTLYVPSFTNDTLLHKPVKRNYYLVSVYDEDTNSDGYINQHDLRRFYVFDIDGSNSTSVVPAGYSVQSSEYDWANDYMFVFAQFDENNNGKADPAEVVHIFWVDLKNPRNNGRLYE